MTLTDLFNQVVDGANTTYSEHDLTTITMVGGGVIRMSTADFDILYNGNVYSAGGTRIDQKTSRTQAHWKVGLDVDQWTVVVMPRPFDAVTGALFPDQIGSVPFLAAAGAALDGADFQVDRVYFAAMPTWPMPPVGVGIAPLGGITIFAGLIDEVDTTDSIAVLTVNDYRVYMAVQIPPHNWQGQCRHTLYDVTCNADGNMNAAAFAINGTVGAGSTQGQIIAPGLAVPAGSKTYKLGRIVMTSGLNATFQRTISNWDGNVTLSLLNPFPFAIGAGDTFTAYPGCDKSFAACVAFNNPLNYGGQKDIPAVETAA